jgi:hypothetical protein
MTAPPERLAMVRILVGGYALVWLALALPGVLALANGDDARFDPVGVVSVLHRPVPVTLVAVVAVATFLAGAAFVAGAAGRLSGPLFAVGFLALATYRNSWGQIFHTENLVVLHLGVLAVVPCADAWAVGARRGPPPSASPRYGRPLVLLSIITVVTYVLAGVAKLRASGTAWIGGDVLRNQIASDNLLKVRFGAPASAVADAALAHAWLFPPMAAATIAIELGAPVALLGGRWRNAWAAGAWLFHMAVLVLMTTFFPYELSGVAFASMFAVERLVWWRWPSRSLAAGRDESPALVPGSL